MATYDSTASRGYYIRLNVNYGNYDIPNNRTPVSWSMTLHSTGYNFGAHTSKANVSINGTSRLSTNQQYTIGKNSSITLGSGSGIWVTHGADGKKTMPFSASFDVVSKASYTPATILTVSGNLVLPTIPRTSSFTAPASYTMGSNFTVTISRATTAFTHGIKVTYGSTVLYNVSGVATSQSVAVNHTALYNATPTITSAALVITVTTFSGNTAIGSVTRNITANNGTRPSAGTLTHYENIEDIKNYFGFYIQGKSRLNVSISGATASTGASIKSYSIAVDGQTLAASSGVTQYIRGSGTLAGSYSVTDSRNYVASGTFSISVAAYTPPTITSTKFYRTNSAGTPDDYGTFAKFELGFRITALNDMNTKSVSISAGSQSTGDVTVGTYTGTYVAQLSGFNVNNSYNVTFRVNDYFGNSQSPQILPTGAVTMMWGRDNLSIGTSELKGPGTLNVKSHIYQNDARVIDYNSVPDGISTSIDFNSYWKQGIINMTSWNRANSSTNSPRTGAGVLITRTLGDYTNTPISTPWLQSWQTYQSLEGIISTRYMGTEANGTPEWSAWQKQVSETTHSLSLLNGWTPYNAAWEPLKATRQGKLVTLTGTLKGGTSNIVAVLPVGFRPKMTQLGVCFLYKGTHQAATVDIHVNGNITCSVGVGSLYTSFNGVTFIL